MAEVIFGNGAVPVPYVSFIGDLLDTFDDISSITVESQTSAKAAFTDSDGVSHDITLTGTNFGAASGTITDLVLTLDDAPYIKASGLQIDFASLSTAVTMAEPSKMDEIIDAFRGTGWDIDFPNSLAEPGHRHTICGTGGDDHIEMDIYKDAYFIDGGNDTVDLNLGQDAIYLSNPFGYAALGTVNVDGGISNKDKLFLGDGPGFTTFDRGQLIDMSDLRFSLNGYDVVVTGVEIVLGTKYADVFKGDDRPNTLEGKGGNDKIEGGLRDDRLFGGQGSDVFIYSTSKDSTAARPDTIEDFTPGQDRIDLSALDPHDPSGRFRFVEGESHTAGDLWVSYHRDGSRFTTTIEANINGGDKPDLEIDMIGKILLHKEDFML